MQVCMQLFAVALGQMAFPFNRQTHLLTGVMRKRHSAVVMALSNQARNVTSVHLTAFPWMPTSTHHRMAKSSARGIAWFPAADLDEAPART
jgi:hypothetical protein